MPLVFHNPHYPQLRVLGCSSCVLEDTVLIYFSLSSVILNRLSANKRASISRAILEIEAIAVMNIHTNVFTSKIAQMWMVLGTGNPGWLKTQPELVFCKAWWLHSN